MFKAEPLMRRADGSAQVGAKAATLPTRELLIDVGLELMRRNGYNATGVQEILKTAGVPRGSFYHYFQSMQEFATALVELYISLEVKHWHEILNNAHQAPLKRLRVYFEDLIRINGMSASIQGCFIGRLSLEVAGSNPTLQQHLSSSFTRWQTAISLVIREAIGRGDLPRSTNPDTLSGFVLNGWERALLRAQTDWSDAPLQDFLQCLFDGYLK